MRRTTTIVMGMNGGKAIYNPIPFSEFYYFAEIEGLNIEEIKILETLDFKYLSLINK